MITFKQFIAEVFGGSNIVKWQVVNESDPLLLVRFKINNSDYLVAVNKAGNLKEKIYSVSFGIDGVPASDAIRIQSEYDLATTLRIYNTIIDIIRVKIKPHLKSGDEVTFEAVSKKTHKVYDRFAKMIAKEINGEYKPSSGAYFKVVKK